jgi:hypothetical protein
MATREKVEGESVGVKVGTAVGVVVPMGGCALAAGDAVALGATVAVGVGATVEVAVSGGGCALGVSTGVKVGPPVEVGDGISVGRLGEQAAASSPAAKVPRACRKLRREMGLATEERPA